MLGLDPGKTTGACFVKVSTLDKSYQQAYQSTEIPLDKLTADFIDSLITTYRADEVVIEDVVKSGHLSKDKFNQIRAFDRCAQGAKKAGIDPDIISPEVRKRGKKEPPKSLTGHVKDAYLIATYKYTGGDGGEADSTPSKEKED